MADPERIAHFRIEGRLGEGGMGVVFRATDETLRRTVAIKVLPPGFEAEDERRARFLREARAAAALNHPNLATVYEIGEAEGRIYIAMEYVAGRTLKAAIAKGPFSVADALAIAKELATALAHAHAAGIIHRDLKPDNVMLGSESRVKVLDFGLAKQSRRDGVADEELETLTEDGRFLGTPAYASPEQVLVGGPPTPASDVFAFGVILHEMLSGERPFKGATVALVFRALERDVPPPASASNPEVPPELDALLARCLAKDPKKRIADGSGIVSALSELPAGSQSAVSVRAKPTRKRGRYSFYAGLVPILAAIAMIGFALRRAPVANPAPAPVASVRPLTMVDFPDPVTSSPAALAHYRTALIDLRAAAVGHANGELAQTVKSDPGFAAALLRYGVYPGLNQGRLREAIRYRDKLDARDQTILSALEPMAVESPPDYAAAAVRLRALSDATPGDAEIAYLWGLADVGAATDREPLGLARALDLDPKMALVELQRALLARQVGRLDEAIIHFRSCTRLSPASATCFRQLANAYALKGECDAFAREGRRSVVVEPDDYWSQLILLAILLREGADEEQLLGVVEHAIHTPYVAALPTMEAESLRAAIGTSARFWFGHLDEARQSGRPGARSGDQGNLHERLEILEELDDDAETRALLRAYMVARPSLDLRFSLAEPWRESSDGVVLRELRRLKILPEARIIALRDQWKTRPLEEWDDKITGDDKWMEYFAEPAMSEADARAALAARDAGPSDPRLEIPRNWAMLGRLYLLAGEPAAAAPWLERAANTCRIIDGNARRSYVASTIHAANELGLAREALHDIPGACAAYARVLERWGDAKPKSITADAARARMKALACPESK